LSFFQYPVERRERLDPREREPRPLQSHVAQIKPHRPGFGDFLDFFEVARRPGPRSYEPQPRGP
jgi:hypothetical protein